MITQATLNRLWPNGDDRIPGLRAAIIATAPAVFQQYGITSDLLVAHVMAQISHECGAGREVIENLNYTAERMMQVWPSRFPSVAAAAPFAGSPRTLANKVYNGRMGNQLYSDDGWTYRGRGATQTTGREGYARLGKITGLDLLASPNLVNDPAHFLRCGVADFIACGCLPHAEADDIMNVTRLLNGGYVGIDERKVWLSKWKSALAAAPVEQPAPPVSQKPAPASKAAPVPPASATPENGSWLVRFIAALFDLFKRN